MTSIDELTSATPADELLPDFGGYSGPLKINSKRQVFVTSRIAVRANRREPLKQVAPRIPFVRLSLPAKQFLVYQF